MTVEVEQEPRRRTLRHDRSGAGELRWPLSRIFAVGVVAATLVALVTIGLGAYALWRLTDARSSLLDVGGQVAEVGRAIPAATASSARRSCGCSATSATAR